MPLRAPSSNLSIYMVFLGTVKFLKNFKIDWYRNGIWPKPRQGNHSSGFVDLVARAIRLKLGARSSCFHHKIYSAASKERSQSRKKSGNGESWLHLCSGCSWELITLLPLLLWDTPRISQKSPTPLQGIENSISSGFNFFFRLQEVQSWSRDDIKYPRSLQLPSSSTLGAFITMAQEAVAPLRFDETLQGDVSEFQAGWRAGTRLYLRKNSPRDSHQNTGLLLAIKEVEISNFLKKSRVISYQHTGKMLKNFGWPQMKIIC